ncbi:MAG: phosphodiesterase [Desulfarculus sp.]|nr:MAG: phosphodiesterase [Desulfarculus sp.]
MAPRLMVIGLDGVGLDLARSLAQRGVMPHLAGLLTEGAAWATASPLPEVSPVCWTSLFSGAGPGEHGVYGFAEPQPGAYYLHPVDSYSVAVPRLWDAASAAGLRSVVLNVPLTYPAAMIKGVMVSGFVTPELSRGVHPLELLPRLQAMGYRPEAELERGRQDAAGLLADLDLALAVRLELFEQMLAEDWSLYAAVVSDTDRVNHFAWPALWEPDHPLAAAALAVYGRIDHFLGRVWELARPEVEAGELRLLVAADHSFGPIVSEVYLNPWLAQQGWLAVEGAPPQERILAATQALALDPGRIYLHWRGRFPEGSLEPGPGAEALLADIAAGLLALRHQGQAVVARVHRGRELYAGPRAHLAPDLVAEAAPGYSLRAGLGRPEVLGTSHLTGVHRPQGALALCLPPPADKPQSVIGLYGPMAQALGLA